MSPMPAQKPGKSEQAVGTPPRFLAAVRTRLGIEDFAVDLAASHDNYICEPYLTEEVNSLVQDWAAWTSGGWGWLNPPFADIYPWAEKCVMEASRGAKVALLVPAATGASWWIDQVRGTGYVTYLQGRITFLGHEIGYPKDLAVVLYAPYLHGGSCTWRWTEDAPALPTRSRKRSPTTAPA